MATTPPETFDRHERLGDFKNSGRSVIHVGESILAEREQSPEELASRQNLSPLGRTKQRLSDVGRSTYKRTASMAERVTRYYTKEEGEEDDFFDLDDSRRGRAEDDFATMPRRRRRCVAGTGRRRGNASRRYVAATGSGRRAHISQVPRRAARRT